MKNKKLFITLLTSILVNITIFSFYSCSFLTVEEIDEHSQESEQNVNDSTSKALTLSVTPLYGNSLQTNSRSAYPDFSDVDLSTYTYSVSCGSIFSETAGEYNSSTGKINFTIYSSTFTTGDITVYAKNSSGKILWSGSETISYSALGQTKNIRIDFKPYTASDVNGLINLTIRTSTNYHIDCDFLTLDDQPVTGVTVTPNSNETTITSSGIAGGTYKAIIKVLNDANTNDIREYLIQQINVWPGLTTNKWYLSDGSQNTVYQIPISDDIVKYYVKGTNPKGLYSSSGLSNVSEASNTNSGSIMHPLASLEAAIAKCQDGTTRYEIICDGNLEGFSMGSSTAYKNADIKIIGGGNSSNYSTITRTTGASYLPVLSLYTSKAFALENITISGTSKNAIYFKTDNNTTGILHLNNCEIKNNKMVGNIGGIDLTSGSVAIKGKIIITGNAYLNNNSDTTGNPRNLCLSSNTKLLVEGPLDPDSRISVFIVNEPPYNFCSGFATYGTGCDVSEIFSTDYESYIIQTNTSTGEPQTANAPVYAVVDGNNCYSLSGTLKLIQKFRSGIESTVTLKSLVTTADLGTTYTANTILKAIFDVEDGAIVNLVFDAAANIAAPADSSVLFGSCHALKTLDLRGLNTSAVVNMSGMFSACTNLESIDLTNFNTSQTTNMWYMFEGCTKLTRLDLSTFNTSKVTNMQEMFDNCSELITIYVSDLWDTSKVTSSSNMFNYCNNITGGKGTVYANLSTSLDVTAARIDGGPSSTTPGFLTRKTYTSANVADAIEALASSTKSTETLYLSGIFYASSLGDINTALKALATQKPSLKVILDFSDASSISFANNNNSTPNQNFKGITNLEEVVLPPNFASFKTSAFENCAGLKRIHITGNLTSIPAKTFYGCSSLESVIIDNQDYWRHTTTSYYIDVSDASANATLLKTDLNGWTRGSLGDAYVTGAQLPGVLEKLENSTSSSASIMCIDSISDEEFTLIQDAFESLGSNNTVTKITLNMANTTITKLPKNSITGTFKNAKNLKEIILPSSLTTIENNCFEGCTNLTTISGMDNVTSLGYGVFSRCTSLTSFNFNTQLPKVDKVFDSMFWECTNLSTITLSNNIKSIEQEAFQDCAFTTCTLPNSLQSIGKKAFYNCNKLQKINIPAATTSIGSVAFHGCSSMTQALFNNTSWIVSSDENGTGETVTVAAQYNAANATKLTNTYENKWWRVANN